MQQVHSRPATQPPGGDCFGSFSPASSSSHHTVLYIPDRGFAERLASGYRMEAVQEIPPGFFYVTSYASFLVIRVHCVHSCEWMARTLPGAHTAKLGANLSNSWTGSKAVKQPPEALLHPTSRSAPGIPVFVYVRRDRSRLKMITIGRYRNRFCQARQKATVTFGGLSSISNGCRMVAYYQRRVLLYMSIGQLSLPITWQNVCPGASNHPSAPLAALLASGLARYHLPNFKPICLISCSRL